MAREPHPSRLDPAQLSAVRTVVRRVRAGVRAELVQASLFGSRARGEARADSDIDVLLIFRWLPPDREPHASIAERIAELAARDTGEPLTVWSVSTRDLARGRRTPMLVDALRDAIPIWARGPAVPSIRFTPEDAARCTGALLDRVREGEAEFVAQLPLDPDAAARRARDDLLRMCTALELLRGRTRLRRGDLARTVLRAERHRLRPADRTVLRWAADSFGPSGRDEDAAPPPIDPRLPAETVGRLRLRVARERAVLVSALASRTRRPAPDLHLTDA